jgi:XapX domain-containing protein
MKAYWIALATGVLVGGIYGLLNVKSPAPPYIALLGLLGMVLGEQAMTYIRSEGFKLPSVARPAGKTASAEVYGSQASSEPRGH